MQKSITQKCTQMYTKTSTGEILMAVASWFQRKKTQADKNLPKKRHGNANYIIQRFPAEQLEGNTERIPKQVGKQDYKLIVYLFTCVFTFNSFVYPSHRSRKSCFWHYLKLLPSIETCCRTFN